MLREIWMRDIRLCMRDDALRVLKLSRKYELGVEIQYFKDPKFNYPILLQNSNKFFLPIRAHTVCPDESGFWDF